MPYGDTGPFPSLPSSNMHIYIFDKTLALTKYYRVVFSKPKEETMNISDGQLLVIMNNKNKLDES